MRLHVLFVMARWISKFKFFRVFFWELMISKWGCYFIYILIYFNK